MGLVKERGEYIYRKITGSEVQKENWEKWEQELKNDTALYSETVSTTSTS